MVLYKKSYLSKTLLFLFKTINSKGETITEIHNPIKIESTNYLNYYFELVWFYFNIFYRQGKIWS